MHGDFRPLRFPGTPADEIDVECTRQYRRAVSNQIRARQRLLDQLRAEESAGTQVADAGHDGNHA